MSFKIDFYVHNTNRDGTQRIAVDFELFYIDVVGLLCDKGKGQK